MNSETQSKITYPPASSTQKLFLLFTLLTVISFFGLFVSAFFRAEFFLIASFLLMIVSLLLTFCLTLYVGMTLKSKKIKTTNVVSNAQFGDFIEKKEFIYIAALGIFVSILLLVFTLSNVISGFEQLSSIAIDLILVCCILILILPLIKGRLVISKRLGLPDLDKFISFSGIPARIIIVIMIIFLIVLILQ